MFLGRVRFFKVVDDIVEELYLHESHDTMTPSGCRSLYHKRFGLYACFIQSHLQRVVLFSLDFIEDHPFVVRRRIARSSDIQATSRQQNLRAQTT